MDEENIKPKKNSVKKNYVFNLIYQIVTIALPLIVTPNVVSNPKPTIANTDMISNTHAFDFFTWITRQVIYLYGMVKYCAQLGIDSF